MKKRSLVLLLCLALVALVAVNDTLATQAENVFKDIFDALGKLVDSPKPTDGSLDVDIVTRNTGVLTPAHYADKFSWDEVENAIVQKKTCAQNMAQQAAFVRICIAVKNADVLMVRAPATVVDYEFVKLTPNGKDYTLYTYDYTGTLTPNATTPEIVFDFALVKETTNKDLADLGSDFVRVQSFAIQASAFAQLDENGNKIPDGTTIVPMKPETALEHALGPIATFDPFQ